MQQNQVDLPHSEFSPELAFLRTQFRWQGREAVHYNLHLHSFGTQKPWRPEDEDADPLELQTWVPFLRQYRYAFSKRAEQVEFILARLEQETLPVIISGDFNDTPNSWTYRQLVKGRKDVFESVGRGWGGTYHAKIPLFRIDFVLVSPEWEAVAAHVPDMELSDHRPLAVQLRWREE